MDLDPSAYGQPDCTAHTQTVRVQVKHDSVVHFLIAFDSPKHGETFRGRTLVATLSFDKRARIVREKHFVRHKRLTVPTDSITPLN
jgi:hypothetical protein